MLGILEGDGSRNRARIHARKEPGVASELYPPSNANTTRPPANPINCTEFQESNIFRPISNLISEACKLDYRFGPINCF